MCGGGFRRTTFEGKVMGARFYLAGIAAGLISIGIGLNISLVFINWHNLPFPTNKSYFENVIPALLTITGWVVTIIFAFRQIEASSNKNLEINSKLLKETRRLSARDSLNNHLESTYAALIDCEQALYVLIVNLPKKIPKKSNPDYKIIFDEINKTHAALKRNTKELQFKITTTLESRTEIKSITNMTDRIQKYLTKEKSWFDTQDKVISLISGNLSNHLQMEIEILTLENIRDLNRIQRDMLSTSVSINTK